jgi:hypothetical protein
MVIWVVTSCEIVDGYNVLEEHDASVFRAEVRSVKKWSVYIGFGEGLGQRGLKIPLISALNMEAYVPPKCWYSLTSPCGVTTQSVIIGIYTAVRPSNAKNESMSSLPPPSSLSTFSQCFPFLRLWFGRQVTKTDLQFKIYVHISRFIKKTLFVSIFIWLPGNRFMHKAIIMRQHRNEKDYLSMENFIIVIIIILSTGTIYFTKKLGE